MVCVVVIFPILPKIYTFVANQNCILVYESIIKLNIMHETCCINFGYITYLFN